MKVIITGATGLVGAAVLRQCIKDPRVLSIIALSRRPLPHDAPRSDKVEVLIHEDFSVYSEDLISQLEGSDACFWCIGGPVNSFPDLQTARRVQVDYTLAAARALAERQHASRSVDKLRFVFCGAAYACREQEQKLWFEADTRHIKGEVETGLIDIANTYKNFETYLMRPAGILPEKTGLWDAIAGRIIPSIKVAELAAFMIEIAVEGGRQQTFENRFMVEGGKAALHQLSTA